MELSRTVSGQVSPLLSRLRLAAAVALAAGLGLGLGGCNAGGNNLLEANRALQERVTTLAGENEALNNANQQLQDALSARDRAMREYETLITQLRGGDSDAEGRLRELEDRLRNARFGNLDAATDAALSDLAAQHPDLIEYIAGLGLLRFKSDVTFDSGSDAVKEAARPTLRQLAEILSGAAGAYDIKILGHTDAQPVVRARAQHPTNMHLSAHRAISVRRELVGMGVAPQRFEVAGRGEFDPIEGNASDGKSARNRRVEVYLMKPSPRSAGGPTTEMSSPAPSPARPAAPAPAPAPRRAEEIMK